MRTDDEPLRRPEPEPAAELDPRSGPRVVQLARPTGLRAVEAGATVMTASLAAAGVLALAAPAVLLAVDAVTGRATAGPVTPALVTLAVFVGLVGVTALLAAVCRSWANAARLAAALANARRDRLAVPGAVDRHRLRDDAATPMLVAGVITVPLGAIALLATGITLFEELARERVTHELVEATVLSFCAVALGVWCVRDSRRLDRRCRADRSLLVSIQGMHAVDRACRRERSEARGLRHVEGIDRPSDEALDAALKRPHRLERVAHLTSAIGVLAIGAGAGSAIVHPSVLVWTVGLCGVALGVAALGTAHRLAVVGGVRADRDRAVLRTRWWPGDAETEPPVSAE